MLATFVMPGVVPGIPILDLREDVIPGMNAIAFTREVRALASLEGWLQARS
jgi:hypothetical protein